MLKAKDIMTAEPVTVTPETELTEAARLLLDRHFNGLPVVDASGHLVGIICQSDLVIQQKRLSMPTFFTLFDGFIPLGSVATFEKEMKKIAAATVGEAMTEDPISVAVDTPIDELATIMIDRNIHTLPVVDGKKLVGVIGKEDILRHLVEQTKAKE